MEEAELEASIQVYQSQLEQVDHALTVATDVDSFANLSKLQDDLQQVIDLTKDSLLSLKKSNLLKLLDAPSSHTGATGSSSADPLDDEYSSFQEAITELSKSCSSDATCDKVPDPGGCGIGGSSSDSGDDDDSDHDVSKEHDLDDITGAKCRIPYRAEWGGPVTWQNAMVVCAMPLDEDSEPSLRVLLCNPTEQAMVPCPYFLDGQCKFSDDECRFSHGYTVAVKELQEYLEPDYSQLVMSSRCRAKFKDRIWHAGTVVDIHKEDNKFVVMYDGYKKTEEVDVEDIIPHDDEEAEVSRNEGLKTLPDGVDDEDDELPVYLWRPSDTTEKLGDWEQHTSGFGSRLMQKMGYVMGQGLGKNCDGRAEPVPIHLIPAGKSLDKIMELKERAGDRDLYDITKRDKRKHAKVMEKNAKNAEKTVKPKLNVFDVINNKLGGKKGNLHTLTGNAHGKKSEQRHIREWELTQKSDKHLNVQLFKTQEELNKLEREIETVEGSLKRNEGSKDVKAVKKMEAKLKSLSKYRSQLRFSASSIERQQTQRKDKKKLAVF